MKCCVILFCVPFWVHSSVHDFHVSRTELQYQSSGHTIQASIHIFADDLARAVLSGTDKSWKSVEHQEADSLVAAYLETHFRVLNGETPVQCRLSGREFTEDKSVLSVTLELQLDSKADRIVIQNSILVDQFGDQRNLLIWKNGTSRGETYMMDKKKTQVSIHIS